MPAFALPHRSPVRRTAVAAFLLGLLACGGSSAPPTPPPVNTANVISVIDVTPATSQLSIGGTAQLTAVPRNSASVALTGRAISWASSATTIASVSPNGLVTAVASGMATITATSEGRSGTATVTVASGAPVASVEVSPPNPIALQGGTLQFTAEPRDSAGAPLQMRTISWSSADTLIARINASTGLATGRAVGSTTITATVEGRTGTRQLAVELVPVRRVGISPTGADLVVGGTRQFTATPRDSAGSALTGRTIAFATRDAGIATVSVGGLVTALAPGATVLRATSGARTDSVPIGVGVAPAAVAAIDVHPKRISLLSGASLRLRPLLTDAAGAPLTGRTITFESSNPLSVTVGADSVVRAVGVGSATVTVASGGVSSSMSVDVPLAVPEFAIDVRNIGPALSAPVADAFEQARIFWQSAVIGDLPDITFGVRTAGICGTNTPTLSTEFVDDLVIFARIDSIDGRGAILGSAGPCVIRNTPGQPASIAGIMTFDSADVSALVANGSLRDVIRHEMGHVLGVGTLWTINGCLSDATTATTTLDTFFSCTAALSAFEAIGGDSYVGGRKVPVENCASGVPSSCGAGTRNGHWRDAVFRTELMTGFLNAGVANPASLLTIASLADLGYVVNFGAREPYVVPGSTVAPRIVGGQGVSIPLLDDIRREPIGVLDRNGRVVRVLRVEP